MSFEELNLHTALKKAIKKSGYTIPTPVQKEAIPELLMGKDLMVSAQTGTGKTAAFLLPILNRLAKPLAKPPRNPKVLILVPTRELALQVTEEAEKFSKYLPHLKVVTIYGGIPYPIQKRKLSRPYEILIATPGRLIDHMQSGRIKLGKVDTFILDEADRMLDMGFINDVETIAENIPDTRQTLLFSATLDRKMISLCDNLLDNPYEIKITPDKTRHKNIDQKVHNVGDLHHKHRLLEHILDDETLDQAIIFTSTKAYADQLVELLQENDHNAAALHGDMNQSKRTRTINKLRNKKIKILVATDVAARGIDIPTITHVINFDLPRQAEDYVHRIGRTGRAGAKGTAFSFVSKKDRNLLAAIEKFTGQKIAPTVIPGFEVKEEPKKNNRGSRRRNSSRPRKFGQNDCRPSKGRKSFSKDRKSSSGESRKSSGRDRKSSSGERKSPGFREASRKRRSRPSKRRSF